MNYKIVVPVLVLGLVAISGAVFISGQKPSELTQTTDTSEAPTTNEEGTAQTPDEVIAANPGVETPSVPTKTPTTPNPVAVGSTIDDILAGFSAATQSEQQVALADDGVTEDMFAQAELSGFETDTYDF